MRTGDVLVELTDRIAVHAHAAAFHAGPNRPASTLVVRGRNWQALATKLAALVSPAPHDDVARADLTSLARLLPGVAPLSIPRRALEADPTIRRTGATLGGAVALMTGVTDHTARTFAKITRTSTVYVPARAPTGEEITDHPELVRARLEGKLAPAPERHLDDVSRLNRGLRPHPSPTTALGLALGHAAADRVVDVEPIGLQVDA